MSRTILFFVFFVCTLSSQAQNYQATYAEFGTLNKGTATLLFNDREWLYTMSYQQEITMRSDNILLGDDEEKEEYESRLFNYYSLDKKYFLWEQKDLGKGCVIKDTLEPMDWKFFSDSTKVIGGYNCILAQIDLCGWDVKAWFTPDIPVSCGPWRLWGLPGLIVSAYSAEGDIDIQLTSLYLSDKSPQEPQIKHRTITTKEKFAGLLQENADKMMRMLNSTQNGRSSTTTFKMKINNPDKCLR